MTTPTTSTAATLRFWASVADAFASKRGHDRMMRKWGAQRRAANAAALRTRADLCAICDDAPATVDALWDDKPVRVCQPCFDHDTGATS